MRELFIEKSFRKESEDIINMANVICDEYAKQGYDLSLRQLYYQFVARGLLENSDRSYKRLGGIISDGRLAGLIDWDYIKDRGRNQISNPHWDNPGEMIQSCSEQFKIDLWEDQEYYIIVMVEKQALEGVIVPVCKKVDVSFIANKGYSSSSTMYEIGCQMYTQWQENSRIPVVVYLGDHDPSGMDMTRDVHDRLELYGRFIPSELIVERIALNMDQIAEHKPPANPAKLTDSRASEYISKFGNESWELDALEPTVLARLILGSIVEYTDDAKFKARLKMQNEWKAELVAISKKITES